MKQMQDIQMYVGDQLDRWNELKEVLHVQTRAEVAKILLYIYFMNLWWCLWSFSVDIIQYM